MRWICTCFLVAILTCAGCSGPTPLVAPRFSAAEVANAAMSEYDTNKDGKLDEKELERCPALKSALADLDANNDKAVGKDELEKRLGEFLANKVALASVSCTVTRGGEPLENAEVRFIPEKFHGDSISKAVGKSTKNGNVELRIEGQPYPGVAQGFYRVEVSHKDAAGQETIPARFNSQTMLGYQIGSRTRGGIEINIP